MHRSDQPWVHRRRRRALIALATLGVVAIGAGSLFYVQWRNRGPDEASVSDAVARFRSSSTVATSPQSALRPPAGVYTYEGEGSESLSFMDTGQPQGPTIPATVTHGAAGCWTFEVEYNSFHRQSWQWCDRGGQLYESGGTTHQKFDFVAFSADETSVFVCTPSFVAIDPSAATGSTVSSHCEGDSETTGAHVVAEGTVQFVGTEPVSVAGEPVPAYHYRFDRELSGGQTGTEHTDMWFAVENGLPLRDDRTIEVVSPAPAPLDSVTYSEHGTFRLTSLTPAR